MEFVSGHLEYHITYFIETLQPCNIGPVCYAHVHDISVHYSYTSQYLREIMKTLPIVWCLSFGATFITTPEISLPSQSFQAIWIPTGRVTEIFCFNVKNCRLN